MWKVTIENNGKELTLRVLNYAEAERIGVLDHTNDGKHYISTFLTRGDIMEWALASKTYDWALPQDFWDKYYRKHGEAPSGVWLYEKGDNWGDFYPYTNALKMYWTAIGAALVGAEELSLPHWVKDAEEAEVEPEDMADLCVRCGDPIDHSDTHLYCSKCG